MDCFGWDVMDLVHLDLFPNASGAVGGTGVDVGRSLVAVLCLEKEGVSFLPKAASKGLSLVAGLVDELKTSSTVGSKDSHALWRLDAKLYRMPGTVLDLTFIWSAFGKQGHDILRIRTPSFFTSVFENRQVQWSSRSTWIVSGAPNKVNKLPKR